MLNIGWIDFSRIDRDRVLSVIRQLTEPGAVDELGIGTIRDGFSNILFPGTSTIQTRAKYLFIIPYICLDLERGGRLSSREFIETLEKTELDLIDVLSKNGAEGIIGQRSRHTLKRKPSSIYWNALRTYGFITEPITLVEYTALIHNRKAEQAQVRNLGKRSGLHVDDTTDDIDVGMSSVSFWRIPPADKKWRETLTISLTNEEANFLRDRILTMPSTRDSLLSLVLRENRLDFPEYKDFKDIDAIQNLMSTELRRVYMLARDFSDFVFGAQIRYNIIYSSKQNDSANKLWEKYKENRPSVNLAEIQARLKPRPNVMRFLRAFQSALDDEKELDRLIVRREKELKGAVRSKLSNTELYKYDDKSVNMDPLVYRMPNSQRIIKDIFEGVGSHA